MPTIESAGSSSDIERTESFRVVFKAFLIECQPLLRVSKEVVQYTYPICSAPVEAVHWQRLTRVAGLAPPSADRLEVPLHLPASAHLRKRRAFANKIIEM